MHTPFTESHGAGGTPNESSSLGTTPPDNTPITPIRGALAPVLSVDKTARTVIGGRKTDAVRWLKLRGLVHTIGKRRVCVVDDVLDAIRGAGGKVEAPPARRSSGMPRVSLPRGPK